MIVESLSRLKKQPFGPTKLDLEADNLVFFKMKTALQLIKYLTISTSLIAVGDKERQEDVRMILPGSDRTLPLVQRLKR